MDNISSILSNNSYYVTVKTHYTLQWMMLTQRSFCECHRLKKQNKHPFNSLFSLGKPAPERLNKSQL